MGSGVTFYPLVLHDGGRNTSLRPGQYADCSVCALATISGKSYDEVYDILAKAGRKPCEGFGSDEWIAKHKGRVLGGIFRPIKVTGYDDRYSQRPPLTPLNFATYHPKGRFLLETLSHTWPVINGIHYDMWRVKQDKPLTGAWEFTFDKRTKKRVDMVGKP